MKLKPLLTLAAAMSLALPAAALDFVYGSWVPAPDYLNTDTLPKAFAAIEKETAGQVKWKLISGGQLADGKGTFNAVKDGVMEAGLAIPIYVPNVVPALAALYSTVTPGQDVVAVSGALVETVMLNCPDCLAEMKKLNAIPLGAYSSSTYQLMCRTPVTKVEDLKGKRVRATGGYGEMMTMAGAVPMSVTLTDTVGLLQRGSLDCVAGAAEWLKTYGYGDTAKNLSSVALGVTGPAIAFMVSRTAWGKMNHEQKVVHLKQSAQMTAVHAIGNFVVKNQKSLEEVVASKGVKLVTTDASFDKLLADYKTKERERVIAAAKGFGVADPAPILDAYARNVQKWTALSKTIGLDTDKFAAALWTEVLSKVNPDSL